MDQPRITLAGALSCVKGEEQIKQQATLFAASFKIGASDQSTPRVRLFLPQGLTITV